MQPPLTSGTAMTAAALGLLVAAWNSSFVVRAVAALIGGAPPDLKLFTELVTLVISVALLIVGASMVFMRRMVGRILMVSGNGVSLVTLTFGPLSYYLVLVLIVPSIILLCVTSTARWLESAPAEPPGLPAQPPGYPPGYPPPPGYPQIWYPPPQGGRPPGW